MTLIKREDAIDAICKEWCYVTYGNCPHVDDGFVCDGCDDVKALNALPSADITDTEECQKCQETTERVLLNKASAEAVQGEWIDKGNWMGIECSRCKCHSRYVTPFCPQCGARMKGGEDE